MRINFKSFKNLSDDDISKDHWRINFNRNVMTLIVLMHSKFYENKLCTVCTEIFILVFNAKRTLLYSFIINY